MTIRMRIELLLSMIAVASLCGCGRSPSGANASPPTPAAAGAVTPASTPEITNASPAASARGGVETPAPDAVPLARCPTQTPMQAVLSLPNDTNASNASGVASTFALQGALDLTNPFFQALGTNGRSCASCHDVKAGLSVTPGLIQQRFAATNGMDPIFRPNDGSVSPKADVSTVAARRLAYRLLLTKGLIRIGLPIPANAEFVLTAVDDPYGFASAAELSLFRRPLPATNLSFDSTIMWDGRESQPGQTLGQGLASQANDATTGHAQGQPLTAAQQQQIVAFETGIFTAQIRDNQAGSLTAYGAVGGPRNLSRQPFSIGLNAPGNPATFNPDAFNLYAAWLGNGGGARARIARGEQLFNRRTFTVQGVKGLNDVAGQPQLQTTCSGCHSAPNAGSISVVTLMDLGLTDGNVRQPDMPLYTLKNLATGATIQTTDPGRGLISGKWAEIAEFKVPTLRALATRAPYFHNGSAPDLAAVVSFYDQRFQIGLSSQDKADLEAFLSAL